MTLADLGNIGEFVGAIGVIATLAYLAYEVSQANRIASSTTIREVEQQYLELYKLIATDAVLSEMAVKIRDPNYKPDTNLEEEKLVNFAKVVTTIWFSTQAAYDRGRIDKDAFQLYLDDVNVKLSEWPALTPYLKRFVEAYPTTHAMEIVAPLLAESVSNGVGRVSPSKPLELDA